MNNKEVFFDCPICNQKFSLEQLLNHNTEAFNDLINDKAQMLVKTQIDERLKAQRNDFEKEKTILKQELNEINNKKINDYEIKLKEMKFNQEQSLNEIKQLENNQKEIIEKNKLIVEKEFSQQINQLNQQLQQLTAENNAKLTKNSNDYENQLKQSKYEKEKLVLELNQIKNNQTELLAKQRLLVEKEFNDKLNELNQQIESLIHSQEIIKQQNLLALKEKESELNNKFINERESLKQTHNQQIEELKIKNAENRILQSKTKGENWEIEVENELHKAFDILDIIEKTTKSIDNKKPDYLQTVRNSQKQVMGKVIYEAKNAKWSDSWIPKLSNDIANNKGKYGILVASSFNEKYQIDAGFKQSDDYENIWISDPFSFIFVAQIIRKLIEVEYNYNQKELRLMNLGNDKLLEEYETKVKAIKDYMSNSLPIFMKHFKNQLTSIGKVKSSLLTNSDKLDKSINALEKQFNKLIIKELEKITGEIVSEGEEYDYNDIVLENDLKNPLDL